MLITTAFPKMASTQCIGAVSTHLDELNSAGRLENSQRFFFPVLANKVGAHIHRANP